MVTLWLAAVAVRMWAPPIPFRTWRGPAPAGRAGLTMAVRGSGLSRWLLPRAVATRWAGLIAAAPVGLGVAAAAGPLPGLAAGLAAMTAATLLTGASVRRNVRTEREVVTTAARALAREIRTGTPPARAVRLVVQAHPAAATVLSHLPGSSGVPGGAVPAGSNSWSDAIAGRFTAGWRLSARHGVPWGAVLDLLAEDLERSARADRDRAAHAAGPRLSGYLLAALPAFGLLLGAGMGAQPLDVLWHTRIGQVLMVLGVGLNCAGLWWTTRLAGGGS